MNVANIAICQRPSPAATPMAPASHMPAPVVRPCTSPRDDAGGKEGNTCGNGLDHADRIDADRFLHRAFSEHRGMNDLDREDGEGGGGDANQDVRAQARRACSPFTLEADGRAKDGGEPQPGDDDREGGEGWVAELLDKLFHRILSLLPPF